LEEQGLPSDSITGFEEFYAEPPMRPEEAVEELEMYDPKYSVATYLPQLLNSRTVVLRRLFKNIEQPVVSTSTVNAYSPPISLSAAFALYPAPLPSCFLDGVDDRARKCSRD
jgi:hypothetical protein